MFSITYWLRSYQKNNLFPFSPAFSFRQAVRLPPPRCLAGTPGGRRQTCIGYHGRAGMSSEIASGGFKAVGPGGPAPFGTGRSARPADLRARPLIFGYPQRAIGAKLRQCTRCSVAAGNLTSDVRNATQHTYQWDAEGRVASVDNGATWGETVTEGWGSRGEAAPRPYRGHLSPLATGTSWCP